ncbi:MAG TPA: flagellar basal body rod protein FlgC [Acidobacteriaceae bacterium]|nr:flagellar basal body rod protein FlgC [Acidobacteriaceae bacterium]
MNLFGVMDISGSALEAERVRAEVVTANMANAETTRTEQGGPYRRQEVVFTSAAVDQPKSFAEAMLSQGALPQVGLLGDPSNEVVNPGVKVAAVVSDTSDPLQRYDPGNPDADKKGYVSYPNINPLTEMVDLMGAERSYGMNVSAVTASKNMISSTMDILK